MVERTHTLQAYCSKCPGSSPNAVWLSNLIYFASDVGGNEYAWDPADSIQADPQEYRFYYLPRLHEDQPVVAGDSFWQFVEWVVADVRSWRDPKSLAEDGPDLSFEPTHVRARKVPLKRDVKRWLA